jgi:hypothetical protein
MKANTRFYAGRVPATASEPNLSGWGHIGLPRTTPMRIGAALGALCCCSAARSLATCRGSQSRSST